MSRLFPSCVPRWFGFLTDGTWEYLVLEWLPAATLEQLYAEGRLSAEEILKHSNTIQSALEATNRASTTVRMRAELEELLQRVIASAAFGAFDTFYLRDVVFPFLRREVDRAEPRTRWTNGDFCSRNVVLDLTGRPRLIDHEFACRSHFFAEDFWRWHTFSDLPSALRSLPGLERQAREPWVEVLFLLRQMVLALEVNGAVAATRDAPILSARIAQIVSRGHDGFSTSLFLRSDSAVPPLPVTRAQWFWSATGEFSEANSFLKEVGPKSWTSIEVTLPHSLPALHLRLDPCDRPGFVVVRNLVLVDDSGAHVPSKWPHPGASWKSWLDATNVAFGWVESMFCIGVVTTDPILILPVLEQPALQPRIRVRADIFWCPHLDGILQEFGTERALALLKSAREDGIGTSPESLAEFEQRERDLVAALEEQKAMMTEAKEELAKTKAALGTQVEACETKAAEVRAMAASVADLQERLAVMQAESESREAIRVRMDAEIAEFQERLAATRGELERGEAIRLRMEAEIAALRSDHDLRIAGIREEHLRELRVAEDCSRQENERLQREHAAQLAKAEERARLAFDFLRDADGHWPCRLARVFDRVVRGRPTMSIVRLRRTGHHFNLEAPSDRFLASSQNPTIVCGWFVDARGIPAKSVRVRNGSSIHVAACIDRHDVASHFRETWPDLSERVGFQVAVPTGIGPRRLVVEAETSDGEVVRLGERVLWMQKHRSVEERLRLRGDDAEIPIELEQGSAREPDVKAIAFYLPQFHAIPENDAWWGAGFTEWTNVAPATPQFQGHYQPHVPHADLGHYDLTNPHVLRKQAEMARHAGIYGFCFYYYWFGGKRLLERPVEAFLANREPDMPFCLCWANENWSRRWDGREREILISQAHSAEDDLAVIKDLARAFKDSRYIRIKGVPLLLMYRPALLPAAIETFARWRAWCREAGVGELHIAGVKGFGCEDPGRWGLDSLVEFPPNDSGAHELPRESVQPSTGFDGKLFDYREVRAACLAPGRPPFRLFRGVMPSWDNTARRKQCGSIFLKSSPGAFGNWLSETVERTRQEHDPDHRILFINAWNEWAEGCHLEPDERFGYAWLNVTRRVLGSYALKTMR